jgi:hypothetical protein
MDKFNSFTWSFTQSGTGFERLTSWPIEQVVDLEFRDVET